MIGKLREMLTATFNWLRCFSKELGMVPSTAITAGGF